MANLLRRQVKYQNAETPVETRSTTDNLSKTRFLGRDPVGECPIPFSLWENGELTERGTLVKDVQDTVWNYLWVRLTRILHKDVLSRVQAQEDMYRNFPDLKDGVHNRRMPWAEYNQTITYLIPRDTGMYVLTKVLTMVREDTDSAQSWVQRMYKGKRKQRVYKRMQTNLIDV